MTKMGEKNKNRRERVSERTCEGPNLYRRTDLETHGSPITNVSPAFTEGTRPSDPTKAAAASLIRAGRAQGRSSSTLVVEHIKRTIGCHRRDSVLP